jgi:hypothetical protein
VRRFVPGAFKINIGRRERKRYRPLVAAWLRV